MAVSWYWPLIVFPSVLMIVVCVCVMYTNVHPLPSSSETPSRRTAVACLICLFFGPSIWFVAATGVSVLWVGYYDSLVEGSFWLSGIVATSFALWVLWEFVRTTYLNFRLALKRT